MDKEYEEAKEPARSWLSRLRKNILPIRPDDTAPVRIIKHSAFYGFAVMVLLVSAAIALAILFAL